MPDQPLIAQNLTEDITPPQTNTSCRKSTFGFIPIMKNNYQKKIFYILRNSSYHRKNMYKWQQNYVLVRHIMCTGGSFLGKKILKLKMQKKKQ